MKSNSEPIIKQIQEQFDKNEGSEQTLSDNIVQAIQNLPKKSDKILEGLTYAIEKQTQKNVSLKRIVKFATGVKYKNIFIESKNDVLSKKVINCVISNLLLEKNQRSNNTIFFKLLGNTNLSFLKDKEVIESFLEVCIIYLGRFQNQDKELLKILTKIILKVNDEKIEKKNVFVIRLIKILVMYFSLIDIKCYRKKIEYMQNLVNIMKCIKQQDFIASIEKIYPDQNEDFLEIVLQICVFTQCIGLKIEEYVLSTTNKGFSYFLKNQTVKSIINEVQKEFNGYSDFSRNNTNLEFNEYSSGFSTSESSGIYHNKQFPMNEDAIESLKIYANNAIAFLLRKKPKLFYKKTNWTKIVSVNNTLRQYEDVLQDADLKPIQFFNKNIEFVNNIDQLVSDNILMEVDEGLTKPKNEVIQEKKDTSENNNMTLEKTKSIEKPIFKKKELGANKMTENLTLAELLNYYKDIHINTKNNQKKILQDVRSMHLAKQKVKETQISLSYILLLTENEKVFYKILQNIGLFINKLPVEIWLFQTTSSKNLSLKGSSLKNFQLEISNAIKNTVLSLFNEICQSQDEKFASILESTSQFVCQKEIINIESYMPELFLDKIIIPGFINFHDFSVNIKSELAIFTQKFFMYNKESMTENKIILQWVQLVLSLKHLFETNEFLQETQSLQNQTNKNQNNDINKSPRKKTREFITQEKPIEKTEHVDIIMFKNLLHLINIFFSNYVEVIYSQIHISVNFLETLMDCKNTEMSLDIKLIVMKLLVSLLKSLSTDDENLDGGSCQDGDEELSDIDLDEDLVLAKKQSNIHSSDKISINLMKNSSENTKNINETIVSDLLKRNLNNILNTKNLLQEHSIEFLCEQIMLIPRNNPVFFDKSKKSSSNVVLLENCKKLFPIITNVKTKQKFLEYILSDYDVSFEYYNDLIEEFLELGGIKSTETDFYYSMANILSMKFQKVTYINNKVLAKLLDKTLIGQNSKNKKVVCNSIRIQGLIIRKISYEQLCETIPYIKTSQKTDSPSENISNELENSIENFIEQFIKDYKVLLTHNFSKYSWNATYSFSLIIKNIYSHQKSINVDDSPSKLFLNKSMLKFTDAIFPVVVENLLSNPNIKLKLHSARVQKKNYGLENISAIHISKVIQVLKFMINSLSDPSTMMDYTYHETKYLNQVQTMCGYLIFRFIPQICYISSEKKLDVIDKNNIMQIMEEKKHTFNEEVKGIFRYAVDHLEKLFESIYQIFKQDLDCVFESEDLDTGKFIEIPNLEQNCCNKTCTETIENVYCTMLALKLYVDLDDDLGVPFGQYCKLESLANGVFKDHKFIVHNIFKQERVITSFD